MHDSFITTTTKRIFVPKDIIFGSVANEHDIIHKEYLVFEEASTKPTLSTTLAKEEEEENSLIYDSHMFKTLCEINKISYPTFPNKESAFCKAYKFLLKDDIIEDNMIPPWHLCLPSAIFKSELKEFVQKLHHIMHVLTKTNTYEYYKNVYQKHDVVFDSLQTAKICSQTFLKCLASDSMTNKDVLSTFAPDLAQNGFTNAPARYLRNSTVTGRTLVERHYPNILFLQKEIREDILTSRFEQDGNICYLDFKSLEPRLLKSISTSSLLCNTKVPLSLSPTSSSSSNDDIYTDIKNAFIEKTDLDIHGISRKVIKQIVLMIMYGAKETAILSTLTNNEFKFENKMLANKLIEYIKNEYFCVDQLLDYLIKQKENSNGVRIFSYYGRPIILPPDVDNYKLINYFIQSSAVDLALFGFRNIILKLKEKQDIIENKIVPLFVLHDALILDVHKDFQPILHKLAKYAGNKGNLYKFEDYEFPIEITIMPK